MGDGEGEASRHREQELTTLYCREKIQHGRDVERGTRGFGRRLSKPFIKYQVGTASALPPKCSALRNFGRVTRTPTIAFANPPPLSILIISN